jgi:hypothetical protein
MSEPGPFKSPPKHELATTFTLVLALLILGVAVISKYSKLIAFEVGLDLLSGVQIFLACWMIVLAGLVGLIYAFHDEPPKWRVFLGWLCTVAFIVFIFYGGVLILEAITQEHPAGVKVSTSPSP